MNIASPARPLFSTASTVFVRTTPSRQATINTRTSRSSNPTIILPRHTNRSHHQQASLLSDKLMRLSPHFLPLFVALDQSPTQRLFTSKKTFTSASACDIRLYVNLAARQTEIRPHDHAIQRVRQQDHPRSGVHKHSRPLNSRTTRPKIERR